MFDQGKIVDVEDANGNTYIELEDINKYWSDGLSLNNSIMKTVTVGGEDISSLDENTTDKYFSSHISRNDLKKLVKECMFG